MSKPVAPHWILTGSELFNDHYEKHIHVFTSEHESQMLKSLIKILLVAAAAILCSQLASLLLKSYRVELHLLDRKLFVLAILVVWMNLASLVTLYSTGQWLRNVPVNDGRIYLAIGFVLYNVDRVLKASTTVTEVLFVIYYLYNLIFV
jgi:hypothetical protein